MKPELIINQSPLARPSVLDKAMNENLRAIHEQKYPSVRSEALKKSQSNAAEGAGKEAA